MLEHVPDEPLVERRRGEGVGADGPDHANGPQRLEEPLDGVDVDVDENQREPEPRGPGGVEEVGALPDGVAGDVPLRQERPGRGDEDPPAWFSRDFFVGMRFALKKTSAIALVSGGR